MAERRLAREVAVGKVIIGGKAPVSIQSMTNTKTDDIAKTLQQVKDLHKAGAEMVRVAVPDESALQALESITSSSPVPIIADIHFRYELAMDSIDKGVAKIRINPGNIGGTENLINIAQKALAKSVAIRIGVNAGSIEKKIRKKYGGITPEALVESAYNFVTVLEKIGFKKVVISIKASDVETTFRAYRLMAAKSDHPFHIGITEAGPLYRGIIKSAVGVGALLLNGLGDTVRVSLSANPVEEIKAAKQILQAAGVRSFGPELISCPTCGRSSIDVLQLAEEVDDLLVDIKKPFKIAVMGCAVNGPGEARDADIGITGNQNIGILFRNGKIISRVPRENLMEKLKEELKKMYKEEVF